MSLTVVYPRNRLIAADRVERIADQLQGECAVYAGKRVVVGGGHVGTICKWNDHDLVSVQIEQE